MARYRRREMIVIRHIHRFLRIKEFRSRTVTLYSQADIYFWYYYDTLLVE